MREEGTNRRPVQGGGREIPAFGVGFGSDVPDELTDVTVVRANGVRRHVSIEREEPEECLQVLDHAARSRIQSASASRARFAMASLRSILPRGGFTSGSMIPNVMLDGS